MQSRPPPPSGRPPPYAFVSRVYKRDLRPVVLVSAVAAAIWALIWAVNAFQNIPGDRQLLPNFVTFDIVLGSLYSAGLAIELFGIGAVAARNLNLVNIYRWLSVVGVFIVFGAGLMEVVLHGVFRSQLIRSCINVATRVVNYERSWFRPYTDRTLDASAASGFCNAAWSRSLAGDIGWLIVITIFGVLIALIALSYYHQLLDPSSVAFRIPRDPNTYQLHDYNRGPYNPYSVPYNSNPYGGPQGQYAPQQTEQFVPPYDPQKLPGYGADAYASVGATASGTEKNRDLEAQGNHGEGSSSQPGPYLPPPGPPPGATSNNPFDDPARRS